MKNLNVKEHYTNFRINKPCHFLLYSFDDPDNQSAVLSKLILDCINRDALLKITKCTRPSAPWVKKNCCCITKQTRQI